MVEEKAKKNGLDYMMAVLDVCEELQVEPEAISKFISKPIVEKLEVEAMDQNMLPKKTSLPV
tara:strand:- start:980 stop:1165 length:186 start_codon:yes stop_codon:yes gene_type:complete